MRSRRNSGQAILLVVVACGLVLIGALGLAIDTAQLYGHQRLAQTAADAAAQAGIMSLFDRTSNVTAHTCTATDAEVPCVYARYNGFNLANDTITLATNVPAPNVSLSSDPNDPITTLQVTITRPVQTGLMRMLGASGTKTIKAVAVAAICSLVVPVPIIVTHQTNSASFNVGGNVTIKICGGPSRSIQVNSTSPTSVAGGGSSVVDLSHAGPLDSGLCTTGTGADFGDTGGPSAYPSTLQLGTKPGAYVQPASPILDPLASVPQPTVPATLGTTAPLANGVNGCPASPPKACKLYGPGEFPSGINVQNETGVFQPGVYYIDSGQSFGNGANGQMLMSTGFPNSAATGGQGMMVYCKGDCTFNVGANSGASLVGSDNSSIYKGILFFEDRNAPSHTGSSSHSLGGGGDMTLQGTIYLTNCYSGSSWLDTSGATVNCTKPMTPTVWQSLRLRGNSGNTTLIKGEIIVSTLDMQGSSAVIQMDLNPAASTVVRQVALVH